MDAKITLLDEIECRQLTWYEHLQRISEEGIPRQILNWVLPEIRSRPKIYRG